MLRINKQKGLCTVDAIAGGSVVWPVAYKLAQSAHINITIGVRLE